MFVGVGFGCSAWPQSLAIERVTVIDATGRAAEADRTVLIDRDRIAAIGPSKTTAVPKNARVVDGSGKFLIPGLWDMHVHGASDTRAPWSHLLFLANGVVGVRDMSGPADAHVRGVRRRLPANIRRLIFTWAVRSWMVRIRCGRIRLLRRTKRQGREVVDQQQQRGADFIKVYSRLPRDVYFAIADEAKKRGIPFEGHVPELVTAVEASDAGQRSIEHLTGVDSGSSRDETEIRAELKHLEELFRAPNATPAQKMDSGKGIIGLNLRIVATYDEATARSLFARFVKNGTWQCPTLTLLRAQIDDPLPANDPRLNYLSKEVRAKWDAGYYKGFPPPARIAMVNLTRVQFDESKRLVGLMDRVERATFLPRTPDTMNPQCFPGFSIHDELALLVDAGLSPLAALQAATRNAAQFMGQIDRSGTVEVGKAADLVLLDKDPLADIHNTRTIEAVVLGGRFFSRAALDAMLAKAQTLANGEDTAGAGKMK